MTRPDGTVTGGPLTNLGLHSRTCDLKRRPVQRNLKAAAGGVPVAARAQLTAQPLHPGGNAGCRSAGQAHLESGDDGRMQPKRSGCAGVGVEHEHERLVIALDRVHSVVVNEVPGAEDDGTVAVDADAAKYVGRVAEHDVGPGLDEVPGKVLVPGRDVVAPIAAPMG